MFVIDASVALAACFEDEASPLVEVALETMRSEAAIAPAIWPFEVANGLRSAERRGRVGEEQLPKLMRLLLALPVKVEEVPLVVALGSVLPHARALLLGAYDAAYVDLAVRRGLPLATADEQLAQAARAAGVELMSVA